MQTANAVRLLREETVKNRSKIMELESKLEQSERENKRLREILDEDYSAVKSYLGLVLGKKSGDLAHAEKVQMRTLLNNEKTGSA
jgi:cell shape-determining protein MreC